MPTKHRPTLTVLAGLNGAGKSNVGFESTTSALRNSSAISMSSASIVLTAWS